MLVQDGAYCCANHELLYPSYPDWCPCGNYEPTSTRWHHFPIDLKDFDDEALKIMKENLQHSAGRIADPNPKANGAMIPLRLMCLAHTVKLVLLQQPSASNSTI